MPNAFVRKLQRGVELTAIDRSRLIEATSRTQVVAPYTNLLREGDVQDNAYVILSGFAYCFKLLTNGERQIVAYLVPGDADGLYGVTTENADYSVVTLTPCTVAFISRDTIDDLLAHNPRIARALWWSLLLEKSSLCASLTNVGQRPAPQRLAYLLCDLLSRLQAVGLARNGSFEIPLKQQDFADILGITSVHTCRILKYLQKIDLLLHDYRTITIVDFDRLKNYADFSPTAY
ncbi:Crp/Fnr family transcriptional regulator [Methylobacterium oryzisoli]|uniref:Crp/Fnr family transcriptional regulator n=1 Tax=Methylobacterium oryzisoli TaxID=3385502 RepID=UPI0038929498